MVGAVADEPNQHAQPNKGEGNLPKSHNDKQRGRELSAGYLHAPGLPVSAEDSKVTGFNPRYLNKR